MERIQSQAAAGGGQRLVIGEDPRPARVADRVRVIRLRIKNAGLEDHPRHDRQEEFRQVGLGEQQIGGEKDPLHGMVALVLQGEAQVNPGGERVSVTPALTATA